MTRAIALVFLMTYALAGVVDTVWCPDGCQAVTTTFPTASRHSSLPEPPALPGVCLFCGTGYIVTARAERLLAMTVVRRPSPLAVAVVLPGEFTPLEHPPRLG